MSNFSQFAGENVTIRAETEDDATLAIDWIETRFDTDGDGLRDLVENTSMIMPVGPKFGQPIEGLEYDNPASDGDNLSDGAELLEVSLSRENESTVGFVRPTAAIANPTLNDTDFEGLEDHTEVVGWNVTVVNTTSGELYRYHNDSLSDPPEAGRTVGQVRFTSSALLADTDFEGLNDSEEKTRTHTDPEQSVTYALTGRNQGFVRDLATRLRGHLHARTVGIVDDGESVGEVTLTDASDDFDFVWDDTAADDALDRFTFRMVDNSLEDGLSGQRTDRWLSNREEVERDEFQGDVDPDEKPEVVLDPWDPDRDDDGLTDGQEILGLTGLRSSSIGVVRSSVVENHTISPVSPDTDGDGYRDGWIGVYNVGYSDSVVLYEEHLHDGDGIETGEIVSEQTRIHFPNIDRFTASATSADIRGIPRHSNVHIGELQWKTDPSRSRSSEVPDTTLDIEVDWLRIAFPADDSEDVRIADYNPFEMKDPSTGTNVLKSTRRDLRLYDIDLEFHRSDRIEGFDLAFICKFEGSGRRGTEDDPCGARFTPEAFNAFEMDMVRKLYHDNTSRLHLVWTNEYDPDDIPTYDPHDRFIVPNPSGLEGHTGSPGQAGLLEPLDRVPYGAVILDEELDNFIQRKKTLAHELGHGLSIGWADDKGDGHIAECYSGSFCIETVFGLLFGGRDTTPERAGLGERDWSIMTSGNGSVAFSENRLSFSLEELGTVDFEDIPTVDDS